MINSTTTLPPQLLCFSHLRWDFVFQRPQHLMTRFSAQGTSVYYLEEPIFVNEEHARLSVEIKTENLTILVPHLPTGITPLEAISAQEGLLEELFGRSDMGSWSFWYYTPMAMEFSRKFHPAVTVFDCMDELSAFRFAPKALKELESELMERAEVVFTGGQSLYEAKMHRHSNIWPVPSSIDKVHFGKARDISEPADQAIISGKKLGFFGVLDERFDLELISELAEQRPDYQIILLGPVVKIDANTLPRARNIHYLGQKSYQELPAYLSGWEVALIPFAINESTQYISPTKTPEYLAAGKPVVSTPIRDVIHPYGDKDLVHIAHDAQGFIAAIDKILNAPVSSLWLERVDFFLRDISWDATQHFMSTQMEAVLSSRPEISRAI